jgi:hypothetical protein
MSIMPRRWLTRKFERKASKLYASRIFITIPKGGALLVAAAILASAYFAFPIMINAIAMVLAVISLITVVASRRQVDKLRDDISFAMRNVDEDIDAPITQQSVLKDLKVNGVNHSDPDYVRVPK